MSWKEILKSEDDIEAYERTLDKAKGKSKTSLTPDAKESVESLLRTAEKQLERLKKLDSLDGSEVQFEETMDRLSAYL